eukprot:3692256-Alexandrium_andersonii.AAC.1
MSASLVGSEMCIRDRPASPSPRFASAPPSTASSAALAAAVAAAAWAGPACLLYTSDAADDM